MSIEIGSKVRCICTMRKGKGYARYGRVAQTGEQGKVARINDLWGVCIVEVDTDKGLVYTHIQNLIEEE